MTKLPRILFISRYIPVDSTRPGCPRVAHFARELKKEADLQLVVFEPGPEIQDVVKNSFLKIHYSPVRRADSGLFSKILHSITSKASIDERVRFPDTLLKRKQWLREVIEDFKPDLIFTRGIETYLSIPENIKIPVVVDFVDSLSLLLKREAEQSKSFIKKVRLNRESASLRNLEAEVFAKANSALFISEKDREEVDSVKSEKSIVIQNGVDVDYYAASETPSKEQLIIFFGVQSYAPNEDASQRIAEEIAPIITRELPDAKIRIIGPGASDRLKEIAAASTNLAVVGEVEDLRPEIWKAKLFLCPLRFGAGMKNKILVALAGGLPVVATPLAVEGMNLGDNVYLGRSAEELAKLSIEILKKPYAENPTRDAVLKSYSWKEKGETLLKLFQGVLSKAN